MHVKNNYNECITNLACSIRKYFELDYQHNTLSYVDELLEKKQPKNVVVILFDGMGSRILDRVLDKEDFFIKNRKKEITTVFPATTTAATYSVMTGLNPVEHGYLGWYSYVEPLDKIIMLFRGIEKDSQKVNKEYDEIRNKLLINRTITDEINEIGKYKSKILFPFGDSPYKDLDNMLEIIKKECQKDGKKYIYAYDTEPDHTMHKLGTDAHEINEIVENINFKVEELSRKLKDTVIFVVADHGHKNIENIMLRDYPDIVDCLEKNTSIEPRAINFFIRENKKQKFEVLFNEYFSNDFDLYTKEDVINSNLFGKGKENEIFRDILGDYLAIAKTNKTLLYGGSEILKSQHAGYTDDEIYVPLIVINTNNI